MSDHDFEKQVNQKLEELKLRPSDTVWMEVEKNIRQHKRRRHFLWLWTAALFITLTTSGVVLYHYTSDTKITTEMAQAKPAALSNEPTTVSPNSTNPNSTHKQATTVQSVPGNASSTPNNETVQSIPPTENNQPGTTPPAAPLTNVPIEKEPAMAAIQEDVHKETIGINNKKPVQQPLAQVAHDNIRESVNANLFTYEKPRYRKKKPVQKALVVHENAVNSKPVAPSLAPTMPPEQHDLNIAMPVMVNDVDHTIATNKAASDLLNSKPVLVMMPDSESTTAVTAMPIKRKPSALWHWGITTNAGVSRIAENKLLELKGLLGKSATNDLAYNTSPAGTNSLINFTSSAVAKKASPVQPDLSFSVGVFVQRAISPRLKISLGLEYTYMSVNTQVGQKVNSPLVINRDTTLAKIVPEYYKSPGYGPVSADATLQNTTASYQAYYSNKYRYRFQFIEIPLLVNWQINKGRRLPPIVFEGGVSISRMLSADALHFEGKNGVYYADKDLFNKTQFNFVAGLNVGLMQKSKHPIWIGPNFRYAFTGLVKKDVSAAQYMWSAGITVKMLLGKL